MKPVRLPAAATHALPRWGLFALCLLYILSGLIGRDPWKNDDAAGFGVMWTMAEGTLQDWVWPNIVGLPVREEGPLAFWVGALCIELAGGWIGAPMAARLSTILFFLIGALSIWYTTFLLGRRADVQPLKLAFGGQPEAKDYGRTLADGALLIYLGSLGLLFYSHTTTAKTLQISLIASLLYCFVRLFATAESPAQSAPPTENFHKHWSAAAAGIILGALVLTGGWVLPLGLFLGSIVLAATRYRTTIIALLALTLPAAFLLPGLWLLLCLQANAFDPAALAAWQQWNTRQLGWPAWETLHYLVKNGVWFTWPAWPFAGWALYMWRKQGQSLHLMVPQLFIVVISALALMNHRSEESILLPLLPPLAILAAFGLPTMKRGAINAVDWFSVMTLTTCAAFIWMGWVAKQTGWPTQLAKNAFKLAPGFKPEFNLLAFIVALLATAGWIALVHWRISRRPPVLWRAVVLSSGGVILCWLLLTTLWMPWINYGKSYAGVAQQIAHTLPQLSGCIATNIGPAQRASFAYFGHLEFADLTTTTPTRCQFVLWQDRVPKKGSKPLGALPTARYGNWQLLWEGHRPSDRDERFRLYKSP